MENDNLFSSPNVLLDVLFEQGLLYLVIKNYAHVEAFNIHIHFSTPFSGVQGKEAIASFAIFERLRYLPPMKEIRIFWDVAAAYFSREDEPTEIESHIIWFDKFDQPYDKTIIHDVGIYQELGYISSIE